MLCRITIYVGLLVCGVSSAAVGQVRISPEESRLLELQSNIYRLQDEIRKLDLAEKQREYEDNLALSRATAELAKLYYDAVEETRRSFGGKSIEEVVSEMLGRAQAVSPQELRELIAGYRAFALTYKLAADDLIRKRVSNLEHSSSLRRSLDDRLAPMEKAIFGEQTGIASSNERYNAALIERQMYEFMKGLSDQERMELAKCRLLGQSTNACTEIFAKRLK